MKEKIVLVVLLFCVSIFHGESQLTSIEYGEASYYADALHGKKTASGEIYYHSEYTAAHRTLPFGTWVRVVNLENDKTVLVRINDRGPFVAGRVIDLSKYAARELDMLGNGVVSVKLEVLPKVPENLKTNSDGHSENDITTEKNFYKMSVRRDTPEGYGVQIRSYRDLSNLLNESEHWPPAIDAPVLVEATFQGDMKIYRIIFGEFKTRKEAEKFMEKIGNDFPGCFVVKY